MKALRPYQRWFGIFFNSEVQKEIEALIETEISKFTQALPNRQVHYSGAVELDFIGGFKQTYFLTSGKLFTTLQFNIWPEQYPGDSQSKCAQILQHYSSSGFGTG